VYADSQLLCLSTAVLACLLPPSSSHHHSQADSIDLSDT
jgi:hypothetical protein